MRARTTHNGGAQKVSQAIEKGRCQQAVRTPRKRRAIFPRMKGHWAQQVCPKHSVRRSHIVEAGRMSRSYFQGCVPLAEDSQRQRRGGKTSRPSEFGLVDFKGAGLSHRSTPACMRLSIHKLVPEKFFVNNYSQKCARLLYKAQLSGKMKKRCPCTASCIVSMRLQ